MDTHSVAHWPFQKVLVANRGEIALRVIRACRELGLRSVAVYSDVDRNALHVRMADEAYHIGPAVAAQSYLSIPALLDVARRSGAQAVHPGYGFLSENAEFVRACTEAGLIFVGPPAEAQLAMGEKTAARRTASEAGVPIVPGAMADVADDAEAVAIAEKIGYPLLLKAAAGGGGKGIRFVRDSRELLPSLRTARSEAMSAFGDSRVYLEKAIAPARHVEVQFIADTHGNVVHLGERECSIQRRHQKLIEESPSPIVDAELRERMTSATINLVRSIQYVNAGTAEFLVGPDRNFYFLEVNARVQVEHPVTEWVTGIDLVQEQFRVAAGLPLSFTQEQVELRGSAIECRISAEDPENRFLPATGTVQALQEPSGPGVRVDSSLYAGLQVPLYYDPLLSKLIVWGKDRMQAIARLRRALDEYHIVGVRTTIPFARWLMDHPRFIAGDMSTDFIAEEWDARLLQKEPEAEEQLSEEQVAAIAAGLLLHAKIEDEKLRRQPLAQNGHEGRSRWRDAVTRW
ncbi:acetyl-CoA carboxylase biotin carboxylase subunit/propionyl-CoA carboxylase alpha chain [Thermosporothrix hazakensis]|jgi:acetyl-CoA carboxylase biotin carboxylase subunit|uniref:biotin carboxylase n=1 Tax=Thermosporothrix hazakensis TaxID=644383 RepID=A0A326U3C4_THEHA|nr:acetyl-CoA carboxylase biotin carboxylase subunit [Thermosporothrix hazakensis]PZW23318.1 acetyl-CoA carboxylase biotin carboxylase subunit/propionyl-CoA carboxylase alpha chain [Thermosporothrix hazakensis]GCE47755.1 acetyl-CoA carboxylase biotin carboxylase subunit [Thermosporothrix hazakensis]